MRELSNQNWELRDQLYHLLHRWPAICGAILVGAIIGWGLSLIWPAYYRASSTVYLGLNAYRRYSDSIFEALANPKYSNIDNYQYWQMSQLDSAVLLERFLDPTLERLRSVDVYWLSIDMDDLRSMLSTEWRTTGSWELIAHHSDPVFASQAVENWVEVSVEIIEQAVNASRKAIMIDHEIQAGETELARVRLRRQHLTLTFLALEDWSNNASKLDTNTPPEPEARWQLFAISAKPADFSPTWMSLLEKQPQEDAPIQDYLTWIEEIKTHLNVEAQLLDQQIRELDETLTEQAHQYALESGASLSFSPNIEIERIEDSSVRIIRPTITFILTGGLMGLLSWLIYQLSIISRSRRTQ